MIIDDCVERVRLADEVMEMKDASARAAGRDDISKYCRYWKEPIKVSTKEHHCFLERSTAHFAFKIASDAL